MRQTETDRYFRTLNARRDMKLIIGSFSLILILIVGYFLVLFIGAFFVELVFIGSAFAGLRIGKDATENWTNAFLAAIIFGGLAWLIKGNLFPYAADYFFEQISSFG